MKQLLILSGKGGTGKTTVSAAFAKISRAKAIADCDVDAPNLDMVLQMKTEAEIADFTGMDKAYINQDQCISCALCLESCRFMAIDKKDGFRVDPYACEGCGVCEFVCPVGAVAMHSAVAGEKLLYREDARIFSTAKLKIGSGTSGLLVTEVKKQMRLAAADDADLAIIDGSPGIGCPVIASVSGVHLVLIVAEPSVSGISDMERIIKTTQIFHTSVCVCINKYDANLPRTEQIEELCGEMNIPVVGRIPFDPAVVHATNNGLTAVDIPSKAGDAIRDVYHRTWDLLFEGTRNTYK